MKLWQVAPFFTHFWNRGTYKTLQHVISCTAVKKWHAAMFCVIPDSKNEWKKWATCQSFIRKEITTYRISTLVPRILNYKWDDVSTNKADSFYILVIYKWLKWHFGCFGKTKTPYIPRPTRSLAFAFINFFQGMEY